jgi:ABC-2 type transport system permease protein
MWLDRSQRQLLSIARLGTVASSVLQGFAANQPATAVADTMRALLNGHDAGASEWHAVAWSIGLIAVSVVLAGVLFNRRAG